jgi:hypothetical protein
MAKVFSEEWPFADEHLELAQWYRVSVNAIATLERFFNACSEVFCPPPEDFLALRLHSILRILVLLCTQRSRL